MQKAQPKAQNMRPPAQHAAMFFISRWTSFLREHIPDSIKAMPVCMVKMSRVQANIQATSSLRSVKVGGVWFLTKYEISNLKEQFKMNE